MMKKMKDTDSQYLTVFNNETVDKSCLWKVTHTCQSYNETDKKLFVASLTLKMIAGINLL